MSSLARAAAALGLATALLATPRPALADEVAAKTVPARATGVAITMPKAWLTREKKGKVTQFIAEEPLDPRDFDFMHLKPWNFVRPKWTIDARRGAKPAAVMAAQLAAMRRYPRFKVQSRKPLKVAGMPAERAVVTYDLPVNALGMKSVPVCVVLYTFAKKGKTFKVDAEVFAGRSLRYLRLYHAMVKSLHVR